MSVSARLDKKQLEQTKAILKSLKKTGKALCISPTGTGKTTLITNVLKDQVKKGSKALVLIHRREQLQQVIDRIKLNCPHLTVSEFMGADKELTGQVVVASVQTISRPETLSKIPNTYFTHILVDEVHHAPAASWTQILKHFRDYKAVGFTATPARPDGRSLAELFGEPSTQTLIREAISLKIFAEPEPLLTLTSATLNGVVGKNGEYKASELERLATFEGRNKAIVGTYLKNGRAKLKELGLTPKTLCFCVNTRHALVMQEAFIKAGVKAKMLVSNAQYLDSLDREEMFKTFLETHEIEVLCVVDIFNEAIDVPDVTCAIMARPSRSAIVYTQQIGRAARYKDETKEKFVLLDFVDNTRKGFSAYSSSNLLGKGAAKSQINVEYVQGELDPIVLQERVDALTVIDDFLTARAEFYATVEEAYEACRNLKINNQKEYRVSYKQDPRLHSNPEMIYKEWGYRKISGFNRSYLKMLSLMPKNVVFKDGQKWKTTEDYYIFIDKDFGEFESKPTWLMASSWKKGFTGHRDRAYSAKNKKEAA